MGESKPKKILFNNVLHLKCSLPKLFRYWLDFVLGIIRLTEREEDVAVALLYERYLLSKVILDLDLLDRTLMSEDIQRKIRESCDIKNQHFLVIKSNLKKKGFIEDGKIAPKMIPRVKQDKGVFLLLFYLEVTDDIQGNS